MKKLIAPSILSADFARLGDEIQAVEKAGADLIHIDVMDGHFVPNITIGPMLVEAARRSTKLPLDVHLMIEHPDFFIPEFAKAGAHMISVHVEACRHLHSTLQLIRKHKAQAGVVLNPHSPVSLVEPVLSDVDFVLIMSVNPGFSGQSFIPKAVDKIRQLSALLDTAKRVIPIEIDGGINATTIGAASQAGASIFVAGSAIFGTRNYAKTIQELRAAL